MLSADDLIQLFLDQYELCKPHAGTTAAWTIAAPYDLICGCGVRLMTSERLSELIPDDEPGMYDEIVLTVVKAAAGVALVYGQGRPSECTPTNGDPDGPRPHRRPARRPHH